MSGLASTTLHRAILVASLVLIPALADDTPDSWSKVRALKTGAELRIIKAGASAPIQAQFAELTDENLVVVVKNEQIAIPRDKVARIDSRPDVGHVSTETRVSGPDGGSAHSSPSPPNASPTSSRAYSTGVVIREKIEYQTIYVRDPKSNVPEKK